MLMTSEDEIDSFLSNFFLTQGVQDCVTNADCFS